MKIVAPNPPGEYAQSCVGRERMFEYFSRQFATPGRLFRLNYAIDMRYGVLHDIATKILQAKPIDVSLGHVNFIWQGDAAAQALRCLAHCDTPTSPINVSGHEILAVRDLAAKLGARLGRDPIIVGTEEPTAWLTDTSQAVKLFGLPIVDTDQLIAWTADWVARVDARASASPPNTRCAMADTDRIAIASSTFRRRACRTRALDRGTLESERGRLAVFPEPGNRVRRARRRRPAGRDRSAAALHLRQRLDQHGAGDRELAPPRPCDQTGRCLSRCRGEARPHRLARCDAGGRHGLRPARDLRRRCNCGGCV